MMRGPVHVYLYTWVCITPLQRMGMQLPYFFITSGKTFHDLFAPHTTQYVGVALTDSARAVLFC